MAKYIEKALLPCYRYLRVVPNDIMEEMVEDLTYFTNLSPKKVAEENDRDAILLFFKKIEKCQNKYAFYIFADDASMRGIPARLNDAVKRLKKEWKRDIPGTTEAQMRNRKQTLAQPVITECLRLLQVAHLGKTLQGLAAAADILEDGSTLESYPKLLLVEGAMYEKYLSGRDMDFDSLFGNLYRGTAYNAFIQIEKNKAGKYGFCIRRITGDEIRVTLMDRLCAGYTFSLTRHGEHSFRIQPCFTCTMRDGTICQKGRKKPCVMDENDCPTKKLSSIRAVLLCLQEYLEKKNETKRKNKNRHNNRNSKSDTERYRMDGMISVFDYFEDGKSGTYRGQRGENRQGYQVRPHVRRSHPRRLPDGRVVNVRASIIHEDRYKGYESSDRINMTATKTLQ